MTDSIEELTGTEHTSLRNPELSMDTVKKLYEVYTGEKPDMAKDKAWHITEVLDAAGIETNKVYSAHSNRVPTSDLKKLRDDLKEDDASLLEKVMP